MTPSRTLSLDPGIRKVGVALWDGRDLIRATTLIAHIPRQTPHLIREWAGDVDLIIVEKMVRYVKRRAAYEDLLKIEAMVGELRALYPGVEVRMITPGAWKGNVPKTIIRKRLIAAGFHIPDHYGHDTVDAIGIGAVGLGILQRGGTNGKSKKKNP